MSLTTLGVGLRVQLTVVAVTLRTQSKLNYDPGFEEFT